VSWRQSCAVERRWYPRQNISGRCPISHRSYRNPTRTWELRWALLDPFEETWHLGLLVHHNAIAALVEIEAADEA
jgi:hypothetical protein